MLGFNPLSGSPLSDVEEGGATPGMALSPGCCCSPDEFYNCGNCAIPKHDLTVSWTNVIIGDGSATMSFISPQTWQSDCTHGLLYLLICSGNQVEFRVIYFLSGSCPTGSQDYCSTLRSNPKRLVQDTLTCGESFLLEASLDSTTCSNLGANGYTSFAVSA